jgi:hypothetical protein
MKMTLHSIPHQKGEYHGLSKPQAQNGDSVEKVDGHRDPSGSDFGAKSSFELLVLIPLWWVIFAHRFLGPTWKAYRVLHFPHSIDFT